MVLEHAVLEVKPAETEAFATAFATAIPIIAASPGCRAVRLEHCVEQANRYLLLVEWDSLEAHTQGFRGSPEYEEWRALLHHFYDPMPTVEHYETVISSKAAR
ncbi:MAG: antibiotic biosynthesis monooxygenase family protein [Acidimicrobiales bacterium]